MKIVPPRFDLLELVEEDARNALMSIGHRRTYSAGSTLYLQEDPSDAMYRIVSGAVRISVNNREGRELIFDIFLPNEFLGIGGIVDGGPRPQTAEVVRNSELLVFERQAIDRLRVEFPSISDALLTIMTVQMRMICGYYAVSCLEQPAIRLAQRLQALASIFGTTSADGYSILARPSQSELAAMVGTTRQTVNRILQLFQANDLIWVGYRELKVLNLQKLRSFAQGEWQIEGI